MHIELDDSCSDVTDTCLYCSWLYVHVQVCNVEGAVARGPVEAVLAEAAVPQPDVGVGGDLAKVPDQGDAL